jgi:hypothetical protein
MFHMGLRSAQKCLPIAVRVMPSLVACDCNDDVVARGWVLDQVQQALDVDLGLVEPYGLKGLVDEHCDSPLPPPTDELLCDVDDERGQLDLGEACGLRSHLGQLPHDVSHARVSYEVFALRVYVDDLKAVLPQ